MKLRGGLVAVGYCLVGENLEGRCSCVMERTHECARTRHWERRQTLRKCLIGGHIWDLRGIFLTAESAPSAARFRPHRNLVNPVNPVLGCKRVEISSEPNSPLM